MFFIYCLLNIIPPLADYIRERQGLSVFLFLEQKMVYFCFAKADHTASLHKIKQTLFCSLPCVVRVIGLEPLAPWDASVPNSSQLTGATKMVRVIGLEPTTSASRTLRATNCATP